MTNVALRHSLPLTLVWASWVSWSPDTGATMHCPNPEITRPGNPAYGRHNKTHWGRPFWFIPVWRTCKLSSYIRPCVVLRMLQSDTGHRPALWRLSSVLRGVLQVFCNAVCVFWVLGHVCGRRRHQSLQLFPLKCLDVLNHDKNQQLIGELRKELTTFRLTKMLYLSCWGRVKIVVSAAMTRNFWSVLPSFKIENLFCCVCWTAYQGNLSGMFPHSLFMYLFKSFLCERTFPAVLSPETFWHKTAKSVSASERRNPSLMFLGFMFLSLKHKCTGQNASTWYQGHVLYFWSCLMFFHQKKKLRSSLVIWPSALLHHCAR